MTARSATACAAAAILLASASAAPAKTLTTMGEVGSAIMDCWSPPAHSEGSSVTLAFSFKRDGTLFGEPRPTDIAVKGDEKTRKAFVKAAVDAVKHCVPLTFSDALASGMGGNVFTLHFRGGKDAEDGTDGRNAAPGAR